MDWMGPSLIESMTRSRVNVRAPAPGVGRRPGRAVARPRGGRGDGQRDARSDDGLLWVAVEFGGWRLRDVGARGPCAGTQDWRSRLSMAGPKPWRTAVVGPSPSTTPTRSTASWWREI